MSPHLTASAFAKASADRSRAPSPGLGGRLAVVAFMLPPPAFAKASTFALADYRGHVAGQARGEGEGVAFMLPPSLPSPARGEGR